MVSIDVDELKGDVNALQQFLKEKLKVEVNIDSKIVNVETKEEQLSRGMVKDYLERFLYRQGLSNSYKVRNNAELIKIVKIKT